MVGTIASTAIAARLLQLSQEDGIGQLMEMNAYLGLTVIGRAQNQNQREVLLPFI
jgi:hypothetical protein